MNFSLLHLTGKLPQGYYISIWNTAKGEKRYSVFWGDDRLMTFKTKTEAHAHAIENNKTVGRVKSGLPQPGI